MVEAVRELPEDDPLAVSVCAALHAGATEELSRMLDEHPYLAHCRIVSSRRRGGTRTLLHVFADWPGHNPNAPAVVALLRAAGADLDAPTTGAGSAETALHWAASSDDLELLDALLDAGANVEARGAVIGGGTAIADATAFGQWRAAERLLERGADTNLFESAVMGLDDRVQAELDAVPPPSAEHITHALWGSCHGGRQDTARMLIDRGADIDWVGWDDLTPLDAAGVRPRNGRTRRPSSTGCVRREPVPPPSSEPTSRHRRWSAGALRRSGRFSEMRPSISVVPEQRAQAASASVSSAMRGEARSRNGTDRV